MGDIFQKECSDMEDKKEGLKRHLSTNFYPPHPQYVIDLTIKGFEDFWAGDEDLEKLKEACFVRDLEALDKYYGCFIK